MHCCALICLHFPIGCNNRCWVSGRSNSVHVRWVHIFPAQHVHWGPESTTNSLSSGFVEDGAGRHQTSEGEKNAALSFSSSLWILLTISRASLRHIVLVARFLPVFYPRTLEHKNDARVVRTSEQHPGDGHFLSRFFLRGVAFLFEKCTLRFGPEDFVLFRKIDLDCGGRKSWITQPICFWFFNKATDPFSTTFLWLFAGLTVNLSVPESALFAKFASRFRFVILTDGRMPIITWRICAVSLKVIAARFLLSPSWRTTASGATSFWRSSGRLCFLSTLIIVVPETASISFWALSFCFPLIAISLFSFSADIRPLLSLNQYSSFDPFISDFEVSRSDHLIYVSPYHGLQLLIIRLRSILIDFLFVHCQYRSELIRLSYSRPVQTLRIFFVFGNFTCRQ